MNGTWLLCPDGDAWDLSSYITPEQVSKLKWWDRVTSCYRLKTKQSLPFWGEC